jgi:hypothetical protein
MPVVSRTLTRLSKPETITQLHKANRNRVAGILPATLLRARNQAFFEGCGRNLLDY